MAENSRSESFFNISVWDQFAYLIPGAVTVFISVIMVALNRHLYIVGIGQDSLGNPLLFGHQLGYYCEQLVEVVKSLFKWPSTVDASGWRWVFALVLFLVFSYATGVIIYKLRTVLSFHKLRKKMLGNAYLELILQEKRKDRIQQHYLRKFYFSGEVRVELIRRILLLNRVDPSKAESMPDINQIRFANYFLRHRFMHMNPAFYTKYDRSTDRPVFGRQLITAIFLPLILFPLIGWLCFGFPYFWVVALAFTFIFLVTQVFLQIDSSKDYFHWEHLIYQSSFHEGPDAPWEKDKRELNKELKKKILNGEI